MSGSASYYLPPAESCHFCAQSGCSHKNICRGLKSVSGFDPSLRLRTCHFGSSGLRFYCKVAITANRWVLKRQLNAHLKKKKKLACYPHANRTNGYLLSSKAMNNLASPFSPYSKCKHKINNPGRVKLLCSKCHLAAAESPWEQTGIPRAPAERGTRRAVRCARSVPQDHSISSHIERVFFSLQMSINTIFHCVDRKRKQWREIKCDQYRLSAEAPTHLDL